MSFFFFFFPDFLSIQNKRTDAEDRPTIIGNESSNGGLTREGSLSRGNIEFEPSPPRSPRPGIKLPRSNTEPKRSPTFWSEDVPYLFTNHEPEGRTRMGRPQDRTTPKWMMMNDL